MWLGGGQRERDLTMGDCFLGVMDMNQNSEFSRDLLLPFF